MFKVLDIAGSAMNAQMVRLNTTASNMANANTVASSEAGAYRAKQPVFATLLRDASDVGGVEVQELLGLDDLGGLVGGGVGGGLDGVGHAAVLHE